ncbi:MAG TPA: RNA polymerase sigma factor [Solirubrobacteraceae bacterium]
MSPALIAAAPADAPPAPSGFEALYRACRDDVYAYVASLLRDAAAAEDVTAQAFERAFRGRRRWDARRGSERAWLFGIARNAALDELRRRKRTAGLTADPADPAVERLVAAEDDEDAAARRAAVCSALASLTPRERDLVALRFHGGLSHAEVARVLGVSESNAQTMLHRTLRKLREACHATL